MKEEELKKYINKVIGEWEFDSPFHVHKYSNSELIDNLKDIVGPIKYIEVFNAMVGKKMISVDKHREWTIEKPYLYAKLKTYKEDTTKDSITKSNERHWKQFRRLIDYYIACEREADKAQFYLNPEKNGSQYTIINSLDPRWLQRLDEKPMVHELSFDNQSASIMATIMNSKEDMCIGYPNLAVYDSRSALKYIIPLGIIPVSYEPGKKLDSYKKLTIKATFDFKHTKINQKWIERVFPDGEMKQIESSLYNMHDGDAYEGMLDFALALPIIMSKANTPGIDPAKIQQYIPNIGSNKNQKAICNTVLIFNAKSSIYVKSLLKELAYLRKAPAKYLDQTALAYIFRDPPLELNTKIKTYPIPFGNSNLEQLQAIKNALNFQVSKLQGPPGTGKTQVSFNMIANAIYNNESVLFCSKNHNAVNAIKSKNTSLFGDDLELIRFCNDEDQISNYWNDIKLENIKVGLDAVTNSEDILAKNYVDKLNLEQKDISEKWEERERLCDEIYKSELNLYNARNSLIGFLSVEYISKPDDFPYSEFFDNAEIVTRFFGRGFKGFLFRAKTSKKKYTGARDYVLGCAKEHKNELNPDGILLFNEYVSALKKSFQLYEEAKVSLAKAEELYKSCNIKDEDIKKYTANKETIDKNKDRALVYSWSESFNEVYKSKAELSLIKQASNDFSRNRYIIDTDTPDSTISKYLNALRPLYKLQPAWATTLLSLNHASPLLPGIFDLAIIDEASQCDPISAIPALYRAKRIALVGDPMQFKPIYDLSEKRDSSFIKAYLNDDSQLMSWAFTSNSAYSLAPDNMNFVMLREHFRCAPDIADYFSKLFYNNRIIKHMDTRQIKYPCISEFSNQSSIQWIDVRDSREREIDEAVRIYKEIINSNYTGTVGIISPIREVVNIVKGKLYAEGFDRERISKVDTAYKFQGGQEDTIIYIVSYNGGNNKGQDWYVTSGDNDNIYNVTISRAKSCLIVIGDKARCANSDSRTLRTLAEYPKYRDPFDSPLEEKLYRAMERRGIRTTPQYIFQGYWFDFAYEDDNIKLDIEVDGKDFHYTEDGYRRHSDIIRDSVSESGGWTVLRFIGTQVYRDVESCVDMVEIEIQHARNTNS